MSAVARPRRLDRAWEVLWALTAAEVRSQRDFTVLGVAKWLLEPVSMTVVYFLLVAVVLNRPQPAFLLFLFCALAPWRFFSGVSIRSMSLVQTHSATLTNRTFPRVVLPLTLLGAEGANFLLALPVFPLLMAAYAIPPTAALLWLPVVIGVLAVLAAGPTYILTLFGLYFPDYRGPVQNFIRALFFLSAGLFRTGDVPGGELPVVFKANPLSGVFESFRAVFVFGVPPRPFDLLYPLAWGVGMLVVGIALYRRREHRFAKEV
jgi:ABC-type polysaccharide/polyol phosphate export permease